MIIIIKEKGVIMAEKLEKPETGGRKITGKSKASKASSPLITFRIKKKKRKGDITGADIPRGLRADDIATN